MTVLEQRFLESVPKELRKLNENLTEIITLPQTRRTAKEAIHRKGAVESHKGYWFYCRPSEDNQRFH